MSELAIRATSRREKESPCQFVQRTQFVFEVEMKRGHGWSQPFAPPGLFSGMEQSLEADDLFPKVPVLFHALTPLLLSQPPTSLPILSKAMAAKPSLGPAPSGRNKVVKKSRRKSPRRTEPEVVEPERRHIVETEGRTHDRRRTVERAATQHTANCTIDH
jgi:hypothetical protein